MAVPVERDPKKIESLTGRASRAVDQMIVKILLKANSLVPLGQQKAGNPAPVVQLKAKVVMAEVSRLVEILQRKQLAMSQRPLQPILRSVRIVVELNPS